LTDFLYSKANQLASYVHICIIALPSQSRIPLS